MGKMKIIGVVAAFIAVILIIAYAVNKSMIGKDSVTGVSNDKIKKAAESVGLSASISKEIAEAPDSAAAARKIGVAPVRAVAIANGIPMDDGIQNILYGPLSDGGCWSGDNLVNLGTAGNPYYKCQKATRKPSQT